MHHLRYNYSEPVCLSRQHNNLPSQCTASANGLTNTQHLIVTPDRQNEMSLWFLKLCKNKWKIQHTTYSTNTKYCKRRIHNI